MYDVPAYFTYGFVFCKIYTTASNDYSINEQDIIHLYFIIQIVI